MTLFEQATPVTADELRRFNHIYQEVKTNGMLAEIPDGKYTATIDAVSLTRATTGNPVLVWKLRVTGPQCAGRMLWKRRAITEKTIPYIKEDLEICGLTLAQFSELPREMGSMAGTEVDVNKRTKDGRYDVYFVRPKANAAAAGADAALDEDVPF
ncbi:MAG: DUF669 domain-containing protein [Bryobacteraceae bacterium]|nr:DUF669 domain-containing protein [Bryobacteraceae bacterium]